MPGLGTRRFRSLLVLAPVLGAIGASTPAAGAAQPSPLSPRLVVLSSPQVRSLGAAKQARRVGLTPSGAGSLLRHGRRVLVDVRFGAGAVARTEALRATGASVVNVSRQFQTVTMAALPGQLRSLAAVPGVEGVQEEITPFTAAACPQGAVVTEGDSQLQADRARELFGVDGEGVTVGILSDSFNQWKDAPKSEPEDVASGDLPGTGNPCGFTQPVKVVTPFIPGAYPEPEEEPENPPGEEEEGEDEGRGMAQIVHDIAPGANIDFASAFNGELAFAKGIRDLYDEGARVIGDDVGYFDEPFFQDGPVAAAVNEVVAKGANYFSAAGNDNLQNAAGENIGSWEAPGYKGMECPEALPSFYESCMNFAPNPGEEDNTFGITVEEEWPLFVDLQWAQPWNGVTTDLDMFLVRNEGKELVETAFNTPNTEPGRQEPYEFIPWEEHEQAGSAEEEVEVVIARCDQACGAARAGEEIGGVFPYAGTEGGDDGTPRLKLAIVNNGGGVVETEYPPAKVEGSEDIVGPTIFGHTAAAAAISVAAIDVRTKERPEPYSSRGPVLHLFGPVEGTTAAKPIGEEAIAKPNVTASDCGATTFFFSEFENEPGRYFFCGTSAATPHAAGIAALIRSANPNASNAEVRAALESTALPIGPLGARYPPSAVGAGLLDAESAVAALALPPTVTIVNPPPAVSSRTRPAIGFTASRRASFACSLDGAAATPCTSPFVPATPLADGNHEFIVTATDAAGRSGSATAKFRVETGSPAPPPPPAPPLPEAKFARHPKAVVKTRAKSVKLSFGLESSQPGSTFLCKVDKGDFRPCQANFALSFKLGRHAVWAEAVDAAGTGRPVASRFRVERAAPQPGKHRHHRH
jgi:subtilisin family serine protease